MSSAPVPGPTVSFVPTLTVGSGTMPPSTGPALAGGGLPASVAGARRIGPYEVVRELGRGGMGVVLLAVDTRNGREVALKLLGEKAGTTALLRFRREFRAVSRLEHPHVVRVYEADLHEQHPYFTMERIEGRSLRQHVEALWGGAGSEQLGRHTGELLELVRQTTEALGYVHGQRLVHRDLKPDNIMVDRSGAARLMDFGLAKQLDASLSVSKSGAIMGTVAYMAPEQILARKEIDGRADFYSLGVTLYEVLCGRRPYDGPNPWAILHQHLAGRPQPPRELAPWLDPELEALVLALMARQPEARPPSAEPILRWLDRLQERSYRAEPPRPVTESNLLVPALVGHDELPAWLARALEATSDAAARPRVVLLAGRAGLGKTRLLEAAGDWARQQLVPLTRAACRQEQRVPFGALAPLLEAAGEQLGWLEPAQQRELRPVAALVPALREVLGADEATSAKDALPAAVRLLEAALAGQPQVYLVDDLHAADELSLEFLELLVRTAPPVPLLLVATYRPGQLGEDHPLRRLAAMDGAAVERRELRPLNEDELARLLASALGAAPAALAHELRLAVALEAGGSPRVALRTLARMIAQQLVLRAGERFTLAGAEAFAAGADEDTLRLVPSGDGLLPGLDTLEQRILQAVAVFGRGMPAELLAAVAEADEPRLLDALNALLQRRALRAARGEAGEAFELAQQAARDEVYARLGEPERRELHGKIARAIEARGEAERDAWLEALAYHWRHAGETDRALELLKQCVKKAARLYAHRDALRLAAEALELLEARKSEPEVYWQQRWDFLSERLRAWFQLGDLAAALQTAELALEAARAVNAPLLLVRAENNLSVIHENLGHFQEAQAHYEQAWRLAHQHDLPDLAASILFNLGTLLVRQGQREQGHEYLKDSLRLLTQKGDVAGQSTTLLNLARLNLDMARLDEARQQLQAVTELTGRADLGVEQLRAWVLEGRALRMQGRWTEAEALWRQAVEEGIRVGDGPWTQRTLLQLADLEVDRGRLERTRHWLVRLMELETSHEPAGDESLDRVLDRLQDRSLRTRCQRLLVKMHLTEGHWAAALSALRTLLGSDEPGDSMELLLVRLLHARALGTVGQMREALQLLEQLERECRATQLDSFLTAIGFTAATLMLETARAPAGLRERLAELHRQAEQRTEGLWTHRIRMRQLVLEKDAAAESWQPPLDAFEREQALADLAQALLLRAELLLAAGRTAEAAEVLERSSGLVHELVSPWTQLMYDGLRALLDASPAGAAAGQRGLAQLRTLAESLESRDRDAFLRRPAVQILRRRLGQRH